MGTAGSAGKDSIEQSAGHCRPLRAFTLPRREIHFPAGFSMGTVSVRGIGRSGLGAAGRSWGSHWREVGQARGRVVVPRGNQLKLALGAGTWPDPAALQRLGPQDLQSLELSGSACAEAILSFATHLTGLESLDLWSAPVGDDAMHHVGALAGLTALNLWGTSVGDAGLAALQPLRNLRCLAAPGRRTGDDGAGYLGELCGLRSLDLAGASVSDAGLAGLTGATSLVHLSLWGTKVTDAGLGHLHRFTSLRDLDLGATAVTDHSLAYLRRLPLRRVSLRDTLVSPEGIRGLQAALPLCRVEPSEATDPCQAWRPPV